MWLFTKYGFFSAVCARDGKSGSGDVDTSRIMVRARVREHLERLTSRFPDNGWGEILESPGNDYRWRVFLKKDAWAEVAASLALDTDYDNFKSAAHREWPTDPDGYCSMLHRVWSNHAAIQTNGKGQRVGAYSSQEKGTLPLDFGNKPKPSRKAGERTQPRAAFDQYVMEDVPVLSDDDLSALREMDEEREQREMVAIAKPIPVKPKRKGKSAPLAGVPASPAFNYPAGYAPGKSRRGHPGATENVFAVIRQGETVPIGIIWWADEMGSGVDAYHEATKRKIIPCGEPGTFVAIERWERVSDVACPVYDWRAYEELAIA